VTELRIKSTLAKGIEPIAGQTYIILAVEETTTAVQGFKGTRIKMTSTNKKDKEEYTTMLWSREEASEKSKLGAFLSAFEKALGTPEQAQETDNWINKTIRIVDWKAKSRVIEVVK
jgi:hypothetical protein